MNAAGRAPACWPRSVGRRALAVVVGCLVLAGGCANLFPGREPAPPPAPSPAPQAARTPETPTDRSSFAATAYSLDGETASGRTVRQGMVAADPSVLPLGTVIRVHGAGSYSGEYTVADTGRSIRGREIDIYVPDAAAAKRFGRQHVEVEIVRRAGGSNAPGGNGTDRSAQ